MTTDNHSEASLDYALSVLEHDGHTVDDLVAHVAGRQSGTSAVTMAWVINELVMKTISKGKRTTYASYARAVVNGLPNLCSCFCPECLARFKGNSSWTACPCVDAGHCNCSLGHLSTGEAKTTSCLEHCGVLGERPFAAVTANDWEQLGGWVTTRAMKRDAVRNRNRSDAGRPTQMHDGRHALEQLRAFGNSVNRVAAGAKIRGADRRLLEDMPIRSRPVLKPRSYGIEQVDELWKAIFTCGSNDAELDMLLVWVLLETGSRRSGPLGAKIGDLLWSSSKIRLAEKNNKVDEQPISRELLDVLLAHALRRGDVLHSKPDDLDIADITVDDVISRRVKLRTGEPVLYYRNWHAKTRTVSHPDGRKEKVLVLDERGEVTLVPHEVGRKRYDTLWKGLKRELPWLEEMHGKPHDLRKTIGTFVERAFGHAVAQRWLRHAVDGTTDNYTLAAVREVEAAHAWLTSDTD